MYSTHVVPMEASKVCQILWSWSYKTMSHRVWELGTERGPLESSKPSQC